MKQSPSQTLCVTWRGGVLKSSTWEGILKKSICCGPKRSLCLEERSKHAGKGLFCKTSVLIWTGPKKWMQFYDHREYFNKVAHLLHNVTLYPLHTVFQSCQLKESCIRAGEGLHLLASHENQHRLKFAITGHAFKSNCIFSSGLLFGLWVMYPEVFSHVHTPQTSSYNPERGLFWWSQNPDWAVGQLLIRDPCHACLDHQALTKTVCTICYGSPPGHMAQCL